VVYLGVKKEAPCDASFEQSFLLFLL